MTARRAHEVYTYEKPEVVEMLARLVTGTSWREPWHTGGGHGAICQADIAAALGMIRDRVSREIVYAVVTRPERPGIERVADIVHPRVEYAIKDAGEARTGLRLDRDEDRYRARLITRDAMTEFVFPERRVPYRRLAANAKMRAASYAAAHKLTTSTIQQAYDEAAGTFKRILR